MSGAEGLTPALRRTVDDFQAMAEADRLQLLLEFADELPALRDAARGIRVSEEVEGYLVRLVRATREHPDLRLGASPRASVALYRAAQAAALLDGRDFVLPDDVASLAGPVLTHRLVVDIDRELRGATPPGAMAEILSQVPVGVGAGVR